jgi:hypothetical protein
MNAWLPAAGKGARPLSCPHARHCALQAVDRYIQINVDVARRNEDRVLLPLNRLQLADHTTDFRLNVSGHGLKIRPVGVAGGPS